MARSLARALLRSMRMPYSIDRLPQDLAELPEPKRTHALTALNDLLEKGASEDEAVKKVRAQLENWVTERAENTLVEKR